MNYGCIKQNFCASHFRPHLAGFLFDTDIAADRCYDQAVAPRPLMSEEQLMAFLEKVKGDTSLQEKLKAASDADAVVAIAKEAGFSISAEDLTKAQSEVSDDELEDAAGGVGLCLITCGFGGSAEVY